MKFKINIDELTSKDVKEKINKAPHLFKEAIAIGLFRIGSGMRTKSARLAPYKTGNLKGSITMSPKMPKNKVTVGTNLEYARIQDL